MAHTISGVRRRNRWLGNAAVALFMLWTLAPFYWMIVTSLKPYGEIYGTTATLYPHHPTLESYITLFFKTPYLIYFRNSAVVSIATTLLTLFFSLLGAYAITRLDFPGRRILARGMVYTYLVPQSLLFIPLFAIMVNTGLNNTLQGLVVSYLGFTLPFCTWLLMGYFLSLPIELEEAALVDGCTRLGVLFRIIVPISLPALAVVAFFSFTLAWNEFLYAQVFVNSANVKTIPTGITNFIIEDVFFWGPIMASTFLSAIPPLIVYFIFQRWLVTGLTMGAVKG